MARELDYVGAFRAAHAFDWAVRYLRTRRVDVRPLLSAAADRARRHEAFELAADRSHTKGSWWRLSGAHDTTPAKGDNHELSAS